MISTRAPSSTDDDTTCTSCRGDTQQPLAMIVTLGREPRGRGARASSQALFEIALCSACAPLAADAIYAFTPSSEKKRKRKKLPKEKPPTIVEMRPGDPWP